MGELTIVIGNKNYSSWSMRAWLALKAAGLSFREIHVGLHQDDARRQIMAHSPSGKVPVLRDGALLVWESLAICEHAAELRPDAPLWPRDAAARALARSIATEMHAGFKRMRDNMPMDLLRDRRGESRADLVRDELDRVQAIWSGARAAFGGAGKFLFGEFGIADAMFAPVVTRFRTYGVEPDRSCAPYLNAVLEWPAFKEWEAGAAAESGIIEFAVFDQPREA